MSLDPPTYLNSLQNNIRSRPIPWEGAVRAGNITEDHLKKIKAVDKVRKEQRRQTVESDLNGYSTLLIGGDGNASVFEHASRRNDIVQYILVLANDLINGSQESCLRQVLNKLTVSRCSLTVVKTPRERPALQSLFSLTFTVTQPRRPSSLAFLDFPYEPCAFQHNKLWETPRQRHTGPTKAVQLFFDLGIKLRYWPTGYWSSGILVTSSNLEFQTAVLGSAKNDTQSTF